MENKLSIQELNKRVPIVVPSYEPDEKLLMLLEALQESGFNEVIVVDDGSEAPSYQEIFAKAKAMGYTVLHHGVNLGKGRALKTAFSYCIYYYPQAVGCVTIDSDGQHTVKDMTACMEALIKNPQSLVLGVRNFNEEGIPLRSSFGNKTTSRVMKVLTGLSISDTQTGLRAIPFSFMKELMEEKGERFEFETNMLLATKETGRSIVEVPIETIYLEENKTSHFHPIRDSIKIYAIFFKFIISSLSSSIVDLVLFSLFIMLLEEHSFGSISHIMLATVLARILSAIYNFTVNYKVVFKSRDNVGRAIAKYACLAVFIMLASGFLVENIYGLLMIPEVLIKIPVDVILFLVSFWVQREFVYK